LGVVDQTLFNWVKVHRAGKLTGAGSKVVSAEQMEISRLRVGADPNLSHRADRILSQGWKPTLRGSAMDKCRC
jgi:transposase-like protein